jgi:hypothetical protein
MKYRILASVLSACLFSLPAFAEPLQYKALAEPLIITAIPVIPVLGQRCPDGTPPTTLTNVVCQEPIEYVCTAYWCQDPVTHKPVLLQRWFGLPNPECRQASMQTEACSNDITIPEKFLPSREDLVKTAPMFYPKEYLTTPLLPPVKK